MLLPTALLSFPNVHKDRLNGLLADKTAPMPNTAGAEFVFICFTNRCGSHFLAELLASSGRFNNAGEYFNYDTVLNRANRFGLRSLRQYLDHICKTLSVDGRLTAKLSATHLVVLHHAGILDEIITRSRFIVLERDDRLDQAISMVIASQTQQWTSYQESSIEVSRLEYSTNTIQDCIWNIIQQQSAFNLFFGLNGLKPFTLIYEQLAEEPETHACRLAAWLGIQDARFDPARIRVQRQSSALNAEWRERFLRRIDRAL